MAPTLLSPIAAIPLMTRTTRYESQTDYNRRDSLLARGLSTDLRQFSTANPLLSTDFPHYVKKQQCCQCYIILHEMHSCWWRLGRSVIIATHRIIRPARLYSNRLIHDLHKQFGVIHLSTVFSTKLEHRPTNSPQGGMTSAPSAAICSMGVVFGLWMNCG